MAISKQRCWLCEYKRPASQFTGSAVIATVPLGQNDKGFVKITVNSHGRALCTVCKSRLIQKAGDAVRL